MPLCIRRNTKNKPHGDWRQLMWWGMAIVTFGGRRWIFCITDGSPDSHNAAEVKPPADVKGLQR